MLVGSGCPGQQWQGSAAVHAYDMLLTMLEVAECTAVHDRGIVLT
jgi:hypothetical protein